VRAAASPNEDLLAPVVGGVASLVTHVALALVLLQLPYQPPGDPTPLWAGVDAIGEGGGETQEGSRSWRATPLAFGGPRNPQNVDVGRRGERGDVVGAERAVLLFTVVDGVTLQDSPTNSPNVSQVQRLRTARDRASWETRRRATPNPDDQPFLASGRGDHRERRPVRTTDAAEGARVAPEPGSPGADRQSPEGEDRGHVAGASDA